MVDRAEAYRRRAEQCERAATAVTDELIRAVYQDMTRQWREMADQAEATNRMLETRNSLLRS